MRKKMTFEKKYPLFAKYFVDVNVQNNMMENQDLFRKYEAFSESLSLFLFELDKRFDKETICKIIVDAVVKLPDAMLISLITAYLNSSEEAKSNPEFLAFYNKTSSLGIASVKYIEKNGLVTDRTYKDIPNSAIDALYQDIKSGYEAFKDESLADVYPLLTYQERKFVIDLIEKRGFAMLNIIFDKLNISLLDLIKLLMQKGVDVSILNEEVIKEISPYFILIMFCLIMDNEDAVGSVDNIRKLCAGKRFGLIKDILTDNLLVALGSVAYEELENLDDDAVLSLLQRKELVLTKQEN